MYPSISKIDLVVVIDRSKRRNVGRLDFVRVRAQLCARENMDEVKGNLRFTAISKLSDKAAIVRIKDRVSLRLFLVDIAIAIGQDRLSMHTKVAINDRGSVYALKRIIDRSISCAV